MWSTLSSNANSGLWRILFRLENETSNRSHSCVTRARHLALRDVCTLIHREHFSPLYMVEAPQDSFHAQIFLGFNCCLNEWWLIANVTIHDSLSHPVFDALFFHLFHLLLKCFLQHGVIALVEEKVVFNMATTTRHIWPSRIFSFCKPTFCHPHPCMTWEVHVYLKSLECFFVVPNAE